MVKGTGMATIFISGHEDVRFEEIDFEFIQDEGSIYTGADGSQAMIINAGTIRLRAQPFPYWQTAFLVSLSYANGQESHHTLEITRNFKEPFEADGWLNYPVIPRRAQFYQE